MRTLKEVLCEKKKKNGLLLLTFLSIFFAGTTFFTFSYQFSTDLFLIKHNFSYNI